MFIESNTIHALRDALVMVEALETSIEDVPLDDITYTAIDRRISDIKRMLQSELSRAESALVDAVR